MLSEREYKIRQRHVIIIRSRSCVDRSGSEARKRDHHVKVEEGSGKEKEGTHNHNGHKAKTPSSMVCLPLVKTEMGRDEGWMMLRGRKNLGRVPPKSRWTPSVARA